MVEKAACFFGSRCISVLPKAVATQQPIAIVSFAYRLHGLTSASGHPASHRGRWKCRTRKCRTWN